MPCGDGTGPMGMGPMTGRAAGYCAGYPAPGFMNPMPGRGFGGGGSFGRGRGGGRGWRRWFYATGAPGWARAGWTPAWGAVPEAAAYASALPPERELQMLRSQSQHLGSALEEIRKRIEELEAAAEKA